MAAIFSIAERDYYVRKLGGTQVPARRVTDIKREYWAKVIGAGFATTPFNQLERQWILKVLADAGITPTTPNYDADLWKQMVISISLTPTNLMDQNKLTFYLNAP